MEILRGSDTRYSELVITCKGGGRKKRKESNSGCQTAGVEAGVSLGLLTHVVLNVELGLVGIVAFSGLQLPEIRRE